jgi:hypothetical protein
MKAVVHTPYYDWDGRKYFELEIDGKVARIKVPFRYGRVMCRVNGLKTIQELQKGDQVEITLEKKTWDGLEHWVLSSIKTE